MSNEGLLSEIIENNMVDTLFQPIADLKTGEVIGYEAYSRGPEGSELYMPIALISEAKSRLKMSQLDSMLAANVLVNAKKRGISNLLFINIDPTYIYENETAVQMKILIEQCQLLTENIVVEFTEKSPICAFDGFVRAVEKYKLAGIKVCFDNISSAYSNLYTLSMLKPDFLKIDRKLVDNIGRNETNKEIIKTVAMVSKLLGTKLLAEGVETKEELETLIKMDVSAAQGMIIGRPGRYFTGISSEAKEIIDPTKNQE